MSRFAFLLAILGLLAGCEPSGTFGSDDDDATSDDDDATSDDDDSVGDDDDSVGDDDDSTGSVVPCRNPDPLPEPEWTLLSDQVVFEGSGTYPNTEGNSWAWFLPTEAEARARFDEFGPLQGDDGQIITDGVAFGGRFDFTKSDLVVVSMVVQASGECGVPAGVYVNNLVDCICFGAHAHWDVWGPSPEPAFSIRTRIFALRDQGFDSAPEAVSVWTEETFRDIPPPE